ncbi:MAG TPA: hypothetical protein VF021_08835 [Longimicrobiales bacterium]
MRKMVLAGICLLAACTAHTENGKVSVQPITDRIGDWSATLTPQNNSGVRGSVAARSAAISTGVSISIAGASSGAQHPWHVHRGGCSDNGAVVGDGSKYPVLSAGADGTASASANIDVGLTEDAVYSVNVHKSPTELNVIVACGTLHP